MDATAVTPTTVSSLGGEELRISGTFPEGAGFTVVALAGARELACFPLARGDGLVVHPERRGTLLRVVTPAILPRAAPYILRVRQQGGGVVDIPAALSVERQGFHSRVYSLRRYLPPTWLTRARRVEYEGYLPDGPEGPLSGTGFVETSGLASADVFARALGQGGVVVHGVAQAVAALYPRGVGAVEVSGEAAASVGDITAHVLLTEAGAPLTTEAGAPLEVE